MASERPTAASIRTNVCMLSSQRPLARERDERGEEAQIAARAPPKRSDTRTPATVTPTQVIQPRKSVNHLTRSSRKLAKPLKALITTLGLEALRWSTSQGLKVVEVGRPGRSTSDWPATRTPPLNAR